MNRLYALLMALGFSVASAQTVEIDSLRKALREYKKKDTAYVLTRINYLKQFVFLHPQDTSMRGYATETLELAQKLDFARGEVAAYQSLGVVAQTVSGDPYLAISYYHKSLEIVRKHPELKRYSAGNNTNIGTILYEQRQFREAIPFLKDAIKDDPMLPNSYLTLGGIYSELKQNDSSAYYYEKTVSLSQKLKSVIAEAIAYSNLCLVYRDMNRLDKAEFAMTRALELVEKNNIEYARPTTYMNASMVYLAKKDLANAEKFAKKALALEYTSQNLFVQSSAWGTLSDVYEEKGDWQNAFAAHKKYFALKDSISADERKLEIARKQATFENEAREAETKAALERESLIRNAISAFVGLLLLFAIAVLYFVRKRQKARADRQELLDKARISSLQMQVLRLQMNPHFLFNTLNSIADYVRRNEVERADYYLGKFAALTRAILENSEEKEIPIAEENNMLQHYVQLENSRMGGRIAFEISVGRDIDPDTTYVPPLLLQPFVENCIWHGGASETTKLNINISYEKVETTLAIRISDDGVGRDATKKLDRKSYGVSITKQRIDLLDSTTNGDFGVEITDLDKGTEVTVRLPLKTDLA